MSSISSNQSSVGNLILASNRLATSRNAAAASNLPVFGKPSIPASGDLKGLYGQLAKSFLARRGTAATDNKQSALAAAATAAATTKANSTSTSSNADGDSVSLTKGTNFKKFTRSSSTTPTTPTQTTSPEVTPAAEPTPAPKATEAPAAEAPAEAAVTPKPAAAAAAIPAEEPAATAKPAATETPAATPKANSSASLDAARSNAARFGGAIVETSTANTYKFSINGESGAFKVAEDGTVSGSIGTGETNLSFTVDNKGNLSIDRGATNTKVTAEDSEQGILIRTLLGKQEAKGQVSGSGMLAAAGSKVITTGNTQVDQKLLKMESELAKSGGTLKRAIGTTSNYTFSTSDGATGTFSPSANDKRIDGTYVKGGQTTNFRIKVEDNGDSSVTTTGGGLLGAVTGTLVRGLLGL